MGSRKPASLPASLCKLAQLCGPSNPLGWPLTLKIMFELQDVVDLLS